MGPVGVLGGSHILIEDHSLVLGGSLWWVLFKGGWELRSLRGILVGVSYEYSSHRRVMQRGTSNVVCGCSV